VVGWVKKNWLLADGRWAWDVPEETIAPLQGLEVPVRVVHRGRGKRRRTVSVRSFRGTEARFSDTSSGAGALK